MIDVGELLQPVPGGEPCGPDLDLEGDLEYLNFFASAETLLPQSYLEVTDAEGNKKRFDPKSVDLNALMDKAGPLLARTRDLRLLVFLAKFAILARDLAVFTALLDTMAVLLDNYWNEVHPRAQDGDWSNRQFSIEALDVLPTVILPLQFQSLVNSRRHGWISYRTCMIAKGEVAPRHDDLVLDMTTLEQQILDKVDLDEFKAVIATIFALAAVVNRLKKLWSEKTEAASVLNLDRLSTLADNMAAYFGEVLKRRDPAAMPPPPSEVEQGGDAAAAPASKSARQIASLAEAAAALEGVAIYFRQFEPSSPALLLILQAQQTLGKSFVEALRILLPNHADAAIINIGKGSFFDLPVQRMAGLLDGASATEAAAATVTDPIIVPSRSQALALLEEVGAFYRAAEPSSPVPYLVDRAKELAQRDFLSLLRDMLPKGALRSS
jgi:type VI secretion system protein ImpA